MKFRFGIFSLLVAAILLPSVFMAHGGTTVTVFGSYSLLTSPSTNYSGIVQSNILLQLNTGTSSTAYSNVLATNDLVGRYQFSLDGSNFVDGTNLYFLSTTGAVAGDTINPIYVSIPVYIRASAQVTNGHNVYIGWQYTHN